MSLKRIFARNVLTGWLSNLLSVGSALVLTPLVIRGVGAHAYGVWVLINQISGYAGVLDLGVQPVVTKYVARARSLGDREELRTLISSAVSIHMGIASLVFGVLLGLSFFLGRCFDLGDVEPGEAQRVLLIAGAGTALGFPASVLSGVLRGYLRIDLVNWITIAVNAFRFVGVLLALSWDRGIIGLAWVSLAANVLGLAGGAVLVYSEAGRQAIALMLPTASSVSLLLSFGIVSFVGTVGWYLSYGTDALVIGAVLRSSDVAHFGLALNVVTILGSAVGVIATTMMPLASDFEGRGEYERIRHVLLVNTRVTLLVAFPLALTLVITGPALLSLWVGQEFGRASGTLLQLLVLAHMPVLANGPAMQVAMGAGRQRAVACLCLAQGVLNLPLSYGLCRLIGVQGTPIATLTLTSCMHLIAFPSFFGSWFHLPRRRVWAESVRPALVPLVPALFVGLALSLVLGKSNDVGTLVPALAIPVIYGSFALMPLRSYFQARCSEQGIQS